MIRILTTSLCVLAALPALSAAAGPYSNQLDGIAATSPAIVGWATGAVDLTRGPMDIASPGDGLASFGTASEALGAANAGGDPTRVVSLGDGGSITLEFAAPIADGPGPDLAVFENTFEFNNQAFAELAFVEVSSNGSDFFRFDAVSLTQTTTQLGAFDPIDSTEVDNLAGKHVAGIGTPFDLAELAGTSPLLDIGAITQVRIVDVVGSLDPAYRTLDSLGNPVNDPYSTAFASSGFDLDAVAVVQAVPEPASLLLFAVAAGAISLAKMRRRVE